MTVVDALVYRATGSFLVAQKTKKTVKEPHMTRKGLEVSLKDATS